MAGGTLVSGDWSVAGATATGTTGQVHANTHIMGKQRYVHLKLTLASGAVARTGVPMPNAGTVGMYRSLTGWILHHSWACVSGRMVTGVVTSNVKNVSFTITSTGHKLFALSSTMVTGTSKEAMQPMATSIEIGSYKFMVTAYGW